MARGLELLAAAAARPQRGLEDGAGVGTVGDAVRGRRRVKGHHRLVHGKGKREPLGGLVGVEHRGRQVGEARPKRVVGAGDEEAALATGLQRPVERGPRADGAAAGAGLGVAPPGCGARGAGGAVLAEVGVEAVCAGWEDGVGGDVGGRVVAKFGVAMKNC